MEDKMKKIEIARQFLTDHLELFRCPVCEQPFVTADEQGLLCPNRHQFDLNKKGTLYFLAKKFSGEYDGEMLAARQRIIQAGLFDGILAKAAETITSSHAAILDVGCGEGTPLNKLLKLRGNQDYGVGFDISKPGINLANNQATPSFFCVADLARLPFNDYSMDVVFDLFSPSAYGEFNRVVKPGGQLIKIIPNSDYLMELRHLLYPEGSKNQSYSNKEVVDLFVKHYPNSTQQQITYQFDLSQVANQDLLIMTPLHWGQGSQPVTAEKLNSLSQITVSVTMLVQQF